jgi:hypothetical protein
MNKCLETVNDRHFWNPGVFSYLAMIPRSPPNSRVSFFFFIVTSIVHGCHCLKKMIFAVGTRKDQINPSRPTYVLNHLSSNDKQRPYFPILATGGNTFSEYNNFANAAMFGAAGTAGEKPAGVSLASLPSIFRDPVPQHEQDTLKPPTLALGVPDMNELPTMEEVSKIDYVSPVDGVAGPSASVVKNDLKGGPAAVLPSINVLSESNVVNEEPVGQVELLYAQPEKAASSENSFVGAGNSEGATPGDKQARPQTSFVPVVVSSLS